MNTEKAILIKDSSLYINQFGELMATEDFKRFFPIDGLYYLANENDVIVIDNIVPYQYSNNGLQEYYKLVRNSNEAADGNNRTETASDPKAKGINYYELEEQEDPEGFLEDISKPSGCLYLLFMLIIIVFTFLMTMKK